MLSDRSIVQFFLDYLEIHRKRKERKQIRKQLEEKANRNNVKRSQNKNIKRRRKLSKEEVSEKSN